MEAVPAKGSGLSGFDIRILTGVGDAPDVCAFHGATGLPRRRAVPGSFCKMRQRPVPASIFMHVGAGYLMQSLTSEYFDWNGEG